MIRGQFVRPSAGERSLRVCFYPELPAFRDLGIPVAEAPVAVIGLVEATTMCSRYLRAIDPSLDTDWEPAEVLEAAQKGHCARCLGLLLLRAKGCA